MADGFVPCNLVGTFGGALGRRGLWRPPAPLGPALAASAALLCGNDATSFSVQTDRAFRSRLRGSSHRGGREVSVRLLVTSCANHWRRYGACVIVGQLGTDALGTASPPRALFRLSLQPLPLSSQSMSTPTSVFRFRALGLSPTPDLRPTVGPMAAACRYPHHSKHQPLWRVGGLIMVPRRRPPIAQSDTNITCHPYCRAERLAGIVVGPARQVEPRAFSFTFVHFSARHRDSDSESFRLRSLRSASTAALTRFAPPL